MSLLGLDDVGHRHTKTATPARNSPDQMDEHLIQMMKSLDIVPLKLGLRLPGDSGPSHSDPEAGVEPFIDPTSGNRRDKFKAKTSEVKDKFGSLSLRGWSGSMNVNALNGH